MASRKEQKEAARQRRLEEERLRAEQARRNRRLQMLGGMVIVVVAVIVVVVAVSSSGGGGLQHGKQASATEKQVTSLLAGIPQSGQTLGDPNAPVTMTYFGDLECPICKAFTLGQEGAGFPQLLANEVKTGKVKVVYKSFCTATCNGPGQGVFNTQQAAAYAAGQQNRFWDFAELFYREQGAEDTGYVNQGYLNGLAVQTPGLNLSSWKSASGNSSLVSQVGTDESAGTALGVTGTPTLFVKGPKGNQTQVPDTGEVPGATYSDIQQAIKQVS
jgi:protein-disulfide isomerase